MGPERWLQVAGYGTWLVTAVPTARAIAAGELRAGPAAAWLTAFVAFGAAFAFFTSTPSGPQSRTSLLSALAVQSLAGLTLTAVGSELAGAMLVVVAGQLTGAMSSRGAAGWVAVQTVLLAPILSTRMNVLTGLSLAASYGGFQLFALAMTSVVASERQARAALARSNADLQATRARLVEQSRLAERLSISRDLHDTLGHHLTALSLQLDVASRVASGKAAEHVQEAHAITRLLLGDVRDVVSRLRDRAPVDVAAEIRALTGGHPSLTIHVEAPETLRLDDQPRAQALVRAVQEIVTNAARHSGAANLWIAVRSQHDGLTIDAHDDGHGAQTLQPGHGLTGMRERFEACGGRVDFSAAPGRGFEIHGVLPDSV